MTAWRSLTAPRLRAEPDKCAKDEALLDTSAIYRYCLMTVEGRTLCDTHTHTDIKDVVHITRTTVTAAGRGAGAEAARAAAAGGAATSAPRSCSCSRSSRATAT